MTRWRVWSKWIPIDEYDRTELATEHQTHRGAYTMARRLCCCGGALEVIVYAPDGTLAHAWSAHDNVWHAHMERPE